MNAAKRAFNQGRGRFTAARGAGYDGGAVTRFFHIFAFSACLLACAAGARAQMTMTARPARHACEKVAVRAFGEEICREAILITDPAQREAVRQAYEAQGLDAATAEKSEALRRLETQVWDMALARKFPPAQTEPTDAEIDAYRAAFRARLAQRQKDGAEISTLIKKLLAENVYAAEDEQTLREILETNDRSVAFFRKREEQRSEMPPEFQKMSDDAERSVAASVVRDWKRNKALFEAYGGRLALRNGRVEPVDADAQFLAWLQKEGRPVVLDAEFRGLFAGLKAWLAKPHDFIPEKETEIYKNYYDSPEWILRFSQEDAALEKNRETLMNVPVLRKKNGAAAPAP
jgi:hypothetical protein